MPVKSKYSKEMKAEVIARYRNGEKAVDLAREYGIERDKLIYVWASNDKHKNRKKEAKPQMITLKESGTALPTGKTKEPMTMIVMLPRSQAANFIKGMIDG